MIVDFQVMILIEVSEAEKYKEEDEKFWRIEAKNKFESYLWCNGSLTDEIKSDFPEDDLETVNNTIENTSSVSHETEEQVFIKIR